MTSPFLWSAYGTPFTAMSSELASLTSGSVVASSVIHSTGIISQTDIGGGYELAVVQWLTGNAYGSAFTQGATLSGWFVKVISSPGGTPSTAIAPNRAPDFTFSPPLTTLGASQILECPDVKLPAFSFYIVVQNNLGVNMSAGSPSLVIAPYSESY